MCYFPSELTECSWIAWKFYQKYHDISTLVRIINCEQHTKIAFTSFALRNIHIGKQFKRRNLSIHELAPTEMSPA